VGRGQGKKAAHVRGLLAEVAGLGVRDVRDLTVRDASTVFRVGLSVHEAVRDALDNHMWDDIKLEVTLPDGLPPEAKQVNGGEAKTGDDGAAASATPPESDAPAPVQESAPEEAAAEPETAPPG
jgi:hypothetical protein